MNTPQRTIRVSDDEWDEWTEHASSRDADVASLLRALMREDIARSAKKRPPALAGLEETYLVLRNAGSEKRPAWEPVAELPDLDAAKAVRRTIERDGSEAAIAALNALRLIP